MGYFCWSCKNELFFDVKVGVKVGRHDECIHCSGDLKCCKNCRHYDASLHAQCAETEASFIRDRERSNFCAHFEFADREHPEQDRDTGAAKANLEAFFSKPK